MVRLGSLRILSRKSFDQTLMTKEYRQPESFTIKIGVFVRPRIFKWQWM